jgi:hypothetical protein
MSRRAWDTDEVEPIRTSESLGDVALFVTVMAVLTGIAVALTILRRRWPGLTPIAIGWWVAAAMFTILWIVLSSTSVIGSIDD